jgi:DNA-binding response OmpR family regulator
MAHRILVVDDEKDQVFAIKAFLETEGYEVVGAYDGQEAVALLGDQTSPPDLVVLDVYMPRISGWDVLRLIRGQEHTRDLPVIMLTAAAKRTADQARGWELEVDWYQIKPLKLEDLAVVIHRLLANR